MNEEPLSVFFDFAHFLIGDFDPEIGGLLHHADREIRAGNLGHARIIVDAVDVEQDAARGIFLHDERLQVAAFQIHAGGESSRAGADDDDVEILFHDVLPRR